MRNYRQNHSSLYNHSHLHQRQQRSYNPRNVPRRRRRNYNNFHDDRRVNDSSYDEDNGSYNVANDHHYEDIITRQLQDQYREAVLIGSSVLDDSLYRLIWNYHVSYYERIDDPSEYLIESSENMLDSIDYMTNQLNDLEIDSSFFTVYDYIRDSEVDEGEEEEEDEEVDDEDVLKYLKIRTHYGDAKVVVVGDDVAAEESSETCAICQSEFEHEDNIGTLPQCGHEYHTSCIKKWLSKKKDCPMCRSFVFPSQEEQRL